jgi:hypothetical protein
MKYASHRPDEKKIPSLWELSDGKFTLSGVLFNGDNLREEQREFAFIVSFINPAESVIDPWTILPIWFHLSEYKIYILKVIAIVDGIYYFASWFKVRPGDSELWSWLKLFNMRRNKGALFVFTVFLLWVEPIQCRHFNWGTPSSKTLQTSVQPELCILEGTRVVSYSRAAYEQFAFPLDSVCLLMLGPFVIWGLPIGLY